MSRRDDDIFSRLGDYSDRLLAVLDARLSDILPKATARVSVRLVTKLATDAQGRILQTPANAKLLRSFDKLLRKELDRLGLEAALAEFTGSFPGQLPYFEETLELLRSRVKVPVPPIKLGASDKSALAVVQATSSDAIAEAVTVGAEAARRRLMTGLGVVRVAELADDLAVSFQTSLPRAITLAETALSTYYRTIQARAVRAVSEGTGLVPVFEYSGPQDKLTRSFCERMLKTKKQRTREEIENLDNGQLPNPFVTGGGYNCRHQWIMVGLREPRGSRQPRITVPAIA